MAQGYPIQFDFSGGMVEARFLMRQDLELYTKSVLEMTNFMPTLSGGAVRAPGTLFVLDIAKTVTGTPNQKLESRVIEWVDRGQLTENYEDRNRRVVLLLTEQRIRAIAGSIDQSSIVGTVATGNRKQVLPNPEFDAGVSGWTFTPPTYISVDGGRLGCRYLPEGVLEVSCRDWKYAIDNKSAQVKTQAEVDIPTSKLQFDYRAAYIGNPGESGDDYSAIIRIGTTEGGDDIGTVDLTTQTFGVSSGSVFYDIGPDFTGTVYVQFDLVAKEFFSTPIWNLDYFALLANSDAAIVEVELNTPYMADDLAEIQYVQSPYDPKEMVLVHPNYPPHRFYYNAQADSYQMEEMPFNPTPGEWDVNNYPAAVTAYQGRLFLSGVPSDPEIVWGSKVYDWTSLTEDFISPDDVPAPDAALKFVTTFRSGTQWMSGQKDLLVGSEYLEYSVRSDGGVLAPNDIDARVQTAHGSARVQPAAYGQTVAFAAERGTRLRLFGLNRDDAGWIAPDMSHYSSALLQSGIRRIVRMRNPHPMIICLTNDGVLKVLHNDPYRGISGWSRLDFSDPVKDICVIPDREGIDSLIMVIDRRVNGVVSTYLEAISNWAYDKVWQYMNSAITYSFTDPTSRITGLDHLEGSNVQVVSDQGYVGVYTVFQGAINLTTEDGVEIFVSNATVGRALTSRMVTLPAIVPPQGGGVGAEKRWAQIGVRGIFSTNLIINGQRNPERRPFAAMNRGQALDILLDSEVVNLGYDRYATITIEENLPLKAEIVSLFGTLTSNKV